MATALAPAGDQRLTLSGISWETYERLLEEHEGRQSPRFTYDRGELEIMVISFEHEESNRLLRDLFFVIAEERGIDFVDAGSTTFKREDQARGFEGDTCIYVENAARVRGRRRLELPEDPPPDLVIEVDITRSSRLKMAVFGSLGIREVWRYDGHSLSFHVWDDEASDYASRDESALLPGLNSKRATEFIADAKSQPRTVWTRRVREWARRTP